MKLCGTKKGFLLGLFGTLYAFTPLMADDTEIFFGGTTNISVRPNVLFVLDTSSSMTDTDGTGVTRLDRMKDALRTILNSTQDVNVGMMRFSNPGGAVIYPLSYIDKPVAEDIAEAVLSGTAQASVEFGIDDSEQLSDNSTINDNPVLSLTTRPAISSSDTLQYQINNGDDDAEERVSDGDLSLTSTDLELMRDGNNKQLVGLRFNNIRVPQGATITAATIDFEVDQKKTGTPLDVDIYGEDSSQPARYSDSAKISSRTKTSAKVDWSITTGPNKNVTLSSPDISAIVEEIVNRGDWVESNSMAFILQEDPSQTANNFRELESYNGESDAAAKLNISYSYSASAVNNDYIALRFNSLKIPQGADITNAYLSVVSAADSSAATSITLFAEDADDSAELGTASNELGARDLTSANVAWSSVPAWTRDETYRSTDIANVIQEVVNRSGWCGGNSLTLLLTGTGERYAKAFEGSSTEAPQIDINYDVASVADGACMVTEQSILINAGSDDVEEDDTGDLYTTSSDLELTNDTGEGRLNQAIGLRFNNLNLKQGASVNSAYIEFATERTSPTELTELTIEVQAIDNASTFSTSNKVSTRTMDSDSVSWTITDQWDTVHAIQKTPDLSGLIEAVVGRDGWKPGNSIVFKITGTGKRVAESYEGSTLAPKLVYAAQDADIAEFNATVRTKLIEVVNDLQYKSGTPIVDSMYEAALYYRGEAVDYGKERGGSSSSRREHARVSHPDSYTGGSLEQPDGCTADNLSATACGEEKITGNPVYTTPITESCQANYIVLLTDGEPHQNNSVSKARTMMGYDNSDSCDGSSGYECGIDLVRYLAENDQLSGMGDNQFVKTYTIGFNNNDPWLSSVSEAGQGSYHTADSAADLVDAFDSILKSIKAIDTTYVEPSVTVNQFNRFTHRDDIYYSLFKPQGTAKWLGNLKKYRLAGVPARVVDANGSPAIDDASGFFSTSARSEWSSDEDGNKVELGGAANQLPAPASRKIYTYLGSDPVVNDATAELSTYPVESTNTDITLDKLGISGQTATYRSELLSWVRGMESDGVTPRYQMGDPLHSKPVLMTYDSDATAGTVDSTIFIGTNEGYLHAVDTDNGEELFAFIPEELLPNLDTFYSNQIVSPRPYGMDGPITLWSKDGNSDGDYLDASDDFVYLYAGMRRGGRSYYALDVSNRANPKMLWQITGGATGTTGFEELGQTWSEPKRITVKYDDGVHELLLFAGGYDTNQDSVTVRTADSKGRAIYMVDAKTGALFWKAGDGNGYDLNLSKMDYSIPSDISVLDMNGDGLADQLYVGDMGGQLWRFDIDQSNVNQKNKLVTGGVIADIAGSTKDSNRRFYYAPDISLAVDNSDRYLALALGSGYRAHPLNEDVLDRFYLIKQFDYIYSAPSSYTTLTESDLYDTTLNLIMEGTDAEKEAAQVALSSSDASRKDGWYIRLTNTGEKVLAESLTLNNQILFTTYEPAATVASSCSASTGQSRIYVVSVKDATPSGDRDNDGDTDKDDRVILLNHGNIPSQPVVVDTEDSPPVVMVGTEPIEGVDSGKQVVRTYWYEDEL